MKPVLLLYRIPATWMAQIAKQPKIAEAWDVVAWHELEGPIEKPPPSIIAQYKTRHDDGAPEEALTREILDKYDVKTALLLTPLRGLTENVAGVLKTQGVGVIWCEVFPGGKLLLDRAGCQYTTDSDIARYGGSFPSLPPTAPNGTRFDQPPARSAAEIRDRAAIVNGDRVVVVFGQVPYDSALLRGPMDYYKWLDAIFTRNPETTFLFKQHPAGLKNRKLLTEGVEGYQNVRVVDESIYSLFHTFRAFASYSSTVIFEGALFGRFFATCGRHFMDGDGMCLRIRHALDAKRLYVRLLEFRPDADAVRTRLAFLTRAYALKPSDPALAQRLSLPSDEFFNLYWEAPA